MMPTWKHSLEITPAVGDAERLKTGLLVLGVFPEGPLTGTALRLDARTGGRLSQVLARGELGATPAAMLLLDHLPGSAAHRILLVGLGPSAVFSEHAYRLALAATARFIADSVVSDAVVTLPEHPVPERSLNWRIQHAAQLLADGGYSFKRRDVREGRRGRHRAKHSIMLLVPQTLTAELIGALRQGIAVAEGVTLARDLGNLPGDVCTPAFLAKTAMEMGQAFGLEVDVLERRDITALGMGTLLQVGKGAANSCRLIVMQSNARRGRGRPIVLIGEGMTFEKAITTAVPGQAGADAMHANVSGVCCVLGAMRTVARLSLPINVIGLVAAAETTIDGPDSRPGYCVRCLSGQMIEIRSREEEDCLLLCDLLTYAERFLPACVVDVAALTDDCAAALGPHASCLFSNNDALAAELMRCAGMSGDRTWQLPLWDDECGQPDSRITCPGNLGGRTGDETTAACFLARFAKAYPWAHIDISRRASISDGSKASTGRPVSLLAEFLIRRAAYAPASGYYAPSLATMEPYR
ncbi:putative cytosol aminopeptidase [Chelatococcus asaccharovorans]|nr:putative cytosol aminopeptidase [Chelatococcus asaccharovorans]CAH1688160.1 putative cytosol aminopeptidase [Chelatococcus asaccharovorans]